MYRLVFSYYPYIPLASQSIIMSVVEAAIKCDVRGVLDWLKQQPDPLTLNCIQYEALKPYLHCDTRLSQLYSQDTTIDFFMPQRPSIEILAFPESIPLIPTIATCFHTRKEILEHDETVVTYLCDFFSRCRTPEVLGRLTGALRFFGFAGSWLRYGPDATNDWFASVLDTGFIQAIPFFPKEWQQVYLFTNGYTNLLHETTVHSIQRTWSMLLVLNEHFELFPPGWLPESCDIHSLLRLFLQPMAEPRWTQNLLRMIIRCCYQASHESMLMNGEEKMTMAELLTPLYTEILDSGQPVLLEQFKNAFDAGWPFASPALYRVPRPIARRDLAWLRILLERCTPRREWIAVFATQSQHVYDWENIARDLLPHPDSPWYPLFVEHFGKHTPTAIEMFCLASSYGQPTQPVLDRVSPLVLPHMLILLIRSKRFEELRSLIADPAFQQRFTRRGLALVQKEIGVDRTKEMLGMLENMKLSE